MAPISARAERSLRKELLLHETCLVSYFARMQRIYDSSKAIKDPDARDEFISATETIDEIREQYLNCLHNINSTKMEMDDNFDPDFNSWSAFKDLYCKVRRVKNQLLKPKIIPTSVSANECVGKRSYPKLGPI